MNRTNQQNPFLFAFGVPRSGTTLLQRILDGHPELAVTNDTHFIPRALELTDKGLLEKADRGLPILLTPELAANVRNYHRFRRLGVEADEFETIQNRSDTYQELVAGLYTTVARKSNKRLAGEKTPDYVRRVRLLHGLFPNAKLIHLIRDGRNVALSLLQWAKPTKGPGRIALWNEHPVAVCALWWRWLVMASQEQTSEIDHDSYLEIRYEDIVARPTERVGSICNFLDLEFSERMLQYHQGKSKPDRSLSAKSAWLAPQPGLRNWEHDMSASQIELFEVLAGDALQTFGYKLKCVGYSNQTIETAQRCQAWWDQHFLAKHERPKNELLESTANSELEQHARAD